MRVVAVAAAAAGGGFLLRQVRLPGPGQLVQPGHGDGPTCPWGGRPRGRRPLVDPGEGHGVRDGRDEVGAAAGGARGRRGRVHRLGHGRVVTCEEASGWQVWQTRSPRRRNENEWGERGDVWHNRMEKLHD